MQLPRPAVEAHAAPVVDPVGGVGILLDLEDQVAAVDRVQLPAAYQNRIARGDREAMDALLQRARGEGRGKGLARDAAAQAHDEVRARLALGQIPVLSLRLPPELASHGGGRVDLQAQPFAAIEPLDQNRERPRGRPSRPHHPRRIRRDYRAQGLAVPRPADDPRLGLGAVDQFPAFADRPVAGGQRAAQRGGEGAATPDAFLIEPGAEEKGGRGWGF